MTRNYLNRNLTLLRQQKLNLGQIDEAAALFKLAIANQVYNFVEYRFAVLELMKLKPAQTEDKKKKRKKCRSQKQLFF